VRKIQMSKLLHDGLATHGPALGVNMSSAMTMVAAFMSRHVDNRGAGHDSLLANMCRALRALNNVLHDVSRGGLSSVQHQHVDQVVRGQLRSMGNLSGVARANVARMNAMLARIADGRWTAERLLPFCRVGIACDDPAERQGVN
jgi:hypothetical protein